MRSLFELDAKNYDMHSKPFIRPSVRGILIHGNKVCMVHSIKYNYYKFPGGGMEPGENQVDTLIREVAEESGLAVIPESIQEYGSVHRIEKGEHNTVLYRTTIITFAAQKIPFIRSVWTPTKRMKNTP